MPAYEALRWIPSLYPREPRVVGGEAARPATLPLDFETSPEPWAYALVFERDEPLPDALGASALVVRVTVEVSRGVVGIGVLNVKRTAFVDEVCVAASGTTAIAEIVIAAGTQAGWLIVRNASTNGASRGRVVEIECFAMEPDPFVEHEPGLSFPRAAARWNRYYGNAGDTRLEKLRVQAFKELTRPTVVRWCDGLQFRLAPGDELSRALYASGTYEPNTMTVLRALLGTGSVFLDVGANAGVFSVVASRWVGPDGHVYAIEPSSREYVRLTDNIQLNHSEDTVTPVRAAIGARTGHAALRVATARHGGLNTLGHAFPYDGIETVGMETVDVMTLDDFASSHGLSRIDVVKLDIEGAEAAALSGARRILQQHRPALILELFSRSLESNDASIDDVARHLREAGYRCFRIDDETAELVPVADLASVDEQNVVAFPAERGFPQET